MEHPKVRFISDPTSQAAYLCFVAKDIASGYYLDAQLPVLPQPQVGSIYFPNLNYPAWFWQSINSCPNHHLDMPFPSECIDYLLPLLSVVTVNTSAWADLEPRFFDLFSQLLNHKHVLETVNQITVLATPFGSHGSFYTRKQGKRINIYATYRTDLPINILIHTLLLALYKAHVRQDAETGTVYWRDRQNLVKYLLTHSTFAELLPNISDYNYNPALLVDSQKYLTGLGFPPTTSALNLDPAIFSPREISLLQHLIDHTGQVVTFDTVADIIWSDQSDAKYSLTAIAKVIENIREKIREQGINRQLITTKRGQGYIFS